MMNDSTNHPRRSTVLCMRVLAGISLLLLVACGSSQRAPVEDASGGPRYLDSGRVHRVNAGETLYVIAWMYDLDPVALARVNNLREPYALNTGQYLSVDLRGTGSTALRSEQAGNAPAPNNSTAASGVTVVPLGGDGAISRTPLGGSLQRTPLPSGTAPTPSPPMAGLPPTAPPPVTRTAPPTAPPTAPAPAPEPAPVGADVQVPATGPLPGAAAGAEVAVARTESRTEAQPVPASPPVAPPEPAVVEAAINWAWPGDGRILARFEESSVDKRGIDLAGNKGDPVRAAADGQVVYAGSGLLRYGDLIILKHNDRFLSAYAHNDRILVREGDFVKQGDRIADLGSSGIDRNMLHFEIRVEGTPVDPLQHLPAR